MARFGLRGRRPAEPDAPTPIDARLAIDTDLAEGVVDASALSGGLTVVITADHEAFFRGEHETLIARAVEAGAHQVLVAVHDVNAGPTATYPALGSLPAPAVLASDRVSATWGGALARARLRARHTTTVVVGVEIDITAAAIIELAAAVGDADGAPVVAQAVVRATDDTITSAGAVLPVPTAPVASFLHGFPFDDAEALGTVEVFAADEPCFAVETAWLAVPVRTVDTRTAIARVTRDSADAAGRPCVAIPLGRVYRTAEIRELRYDRDAADALAVWAGRTDATAHRALDRLGLEIDRVDGGVAGLPVALREPRLLVRRTAEAVAVRERAERLRWSIKIAAHPGPRGDDWGDLFFARDLRDALTSLGQDVVIDHRESHVRPWSEYLDDVSLVLRGLDDTPTNPAACNVLWVISHPERVEPSELARFDLRFSAGPAWGAEAAAASGLSIAPLLQATNPARFAPGPVDDDLRSDVAFVGKTRDVFRPVVRDALAAGVDLSIWGSGWDGLVPDVVIRGAFVANDRLPALYRSARVVLNDHWPDMAAGGFISNRVFDAAAAGALVVTDHVAGVDDLFGASVVTYDTVAKLRQAIDAAPRDPGLRAERAARIGREQSFTARAEVLCDAVRRWRAERPNGT